MKIEKYFLNFFRLRITLQIVKILWLKNLKILCFQLILLMMSLEKKLLEHFTKINATKTDQIEFISEKVVKKVISDMLNKNDTIICLIVGLMKKYSINKWIFSKTGIVWRKCKSWIKFV